MKLTYLSGIKLLAVAALIFGGLGLITAASLAAVGTPDANLRFFFTFFDAALNLLVAYGFWTLRSWAWWLGVVLTGFGLIVGITSLPGAPSLSGVLLSLTVRCLIMAYLLTTAVRRAFGRVRAD
ncbi:MAG: hypothetical protein HY870_22195 [Chloroflexi bacterium]|nr:hypothetical protein [Chloroflexota bacterium]